VSEHLVAFVRRYSLSGIRNEKSGRGQTVFGGPVDTSDSERDGRLVVIDRIAKEVLQEV